MLCNAKISLFFYILISTIPCYSYANNDKCWNVIINNSLHRSITVDNNDSDRYYGCNSDEKVYSLNANSSTVVNVSVNTFINLHINGGFSDPFFYVTKTFTIINCTPSSGMNGYLCDTEK